MSSATLLSEHDLEGIVWQVWTAYLGSKPDHSPRDVPRAAFDVTASVSIGGAWTGRATIRCSYDAAAGMASTMLDVPLGVIGPEDVTDAIGELMNIVAGNVKSMLPQPAWVALPEVVLGRVDVEWPRAELICEIQVHFGDAPVAVGVLRVAPGPPS